jgi:amidase
VASDRGLVSATACAVVGKLNSGEVTPLDLLDALEQRIAEVDGKVNALPTLCFDRARARAGALMKKPAGERGLLAGLPVPIKDLTDVEGVLTTHGSPIYKDRIPARSDLLVEHLEDSGGVIYAKSNTPEFGAGANTFNEVFGATRNPWDTSRSAAGSSGGAAVALATGMAGSHTAPTRAVPCATPQASVASSACGRASAASPTRQPPRSTAISVCRVPWRAMSRILRCCSTQ